MPLKHGHTHFLEPWDNLDVSATLAGIIRSFVQNYIIFCMKIFLPLK